MRKPNFIVIGAARCATTSLHKYLQQHPDIFLSDPKELNYFSKDKFFNKGEAWYLSHFQHATQKAVGEASTSYTSAPNVAPVPERIKALLGTSIKFVFIVRNPIERLLSHYSHYVLRGQAMPSLATVIQEKTHSIVHQGLYHYQLELFLTHFDKSQFKVITVEQLKKENETVMRDIYRFLEVDSKLELDFNVKIHNKNKDIVKMTPFGQRLMQHYNSVFEYRPLPTPIKSFVSKIARLGGEEFQLPKLTRAQEDDLIEFYQADLKKLKRDWAVDVSLR